MTSSNASTAPGGAKTPLSIALLSQTTILLFCSTYTERLAATARELNKDTDILVTIVPAALLESRGWRAAAAAHLAAFIARRRGRTIAKTPGLDTILYMLGTRNISKALHHAPRDGDKVYIIASCQLSRAQDCTRALKDAGAWSCSPPGEPNTWRLHATQAATYPIEARVYRQGEVENL